MSMFFNKYERISNDHSKPNAGSQCMLDRNASQWLQSTGQTGCLIYPSHPQVDPPNGDVNRGGGFGKA